MANTREGALKNLKGGLVSVKHGAYSYLANNSVPCGEELCPMWRECPLKIEKREQKCLLLQSYQEYLMQEMLKAPHINPERDKYAIKLLVRDLGFLWVVDRWIEKHGLVRKKGEPQFARIMHDYYIIKNSCHRLFNDLGFTPRGYKDLLHRGKTGSWDFAEAMKEVHGDSKE